MPRPLRPLVVLGVAALLAAVPSCTKDDGNVLKVYSGRHYDVEKAFTQFEEETGIEVEFLTGNDAELRERIAAEGEDTEADVYLTVDAGNLAAAAEEGLFQPLESKELERIIPANYRDPDDLWFGLAIRARTIIYNTDALTPAEAPTTYEELADPEWEGRLCMRNANNAYQQSLVASLIAVDGEEATLEVLDGWATNADIYANDVEIIEELAAGHCDAAVVNHYYLARALEEDPDLPVELVWADQQAQGVHINISGGGITRYADDPDLARQFIEWLATKGQSALVDSNHEYPASTEAEPEPLIAERFGTDFKRQDISASEYGALNADAVRLMDEAEFG